MSGLLQGKTALITAASRGIGRSIAVRLATEGALVVINYASNENAARETLRLIESEGGDGFLIKALLGTPEAAATVVKVLEAELMRRNGSAHLDILVNNAGGGDSLDIERITPELYDRIIADNIGSTFFLTKAVLPLLRRGGRVINISSAGARLALAENMLYCMSKAAVNVFTQAMAKYLGPRGITVNAVSPGYTATDQIETHMANAELMRQVEAMTALGRPYGRPEEIADVVLSVASPAMGWVTGQIIEASGGFRM